jgi:uncharacterized protein with HEPN domain
MRPCVPPRDSSLRLEDIIEAITRIRRYTATHTLESFAADDMTVDAVVRNLEVIGEAARHVDEETVRRLAAVPWRECAISGTCSRMSTSA